jgi:hypothetical protein
VYVDYPSNKSLEHEEKHKNLVTMIDTNWPVPFIKLRIDCFRIVHAAIWAIIVHFPKNLKTEA